MPFALSPHRVTIAACAVLFAVQAGAQALAPPKAQIVALTATDGVHPGGTLQAAIRVRLPEGLHMNSNAPRDPSLVPAVLTPDPPEGVSVVEVVYPEPAELVQQAATQPLLVYDREFSIGVRFDVGPDVAPGDIKVPARLRYQACDERVCYFPTTVASEWTVRVVPPATSVKTVNRDVFQAIRFGTGTAPAAVVPGPTLNTRAAAPSDPLALLDRFTVSGSAGGYLGRDDFLRFIRNAESGVQETGWFEGRGWLAIVGIVLLGGLALNLTPCVLPMIPINLAIIGAGARAQTRRRGFLLGSAYGAAMALVYGVLGLIVIVTAGTFGTLNASPWFNVAIASVFIALGLAMFDVFTIDFSRFVTGVHLGTTSRGTYLVAFGMGGIAALLAGACVAPVVIQVVLFSSNLYASGTTAALTLPFLLGVGMAVPWPIAGAGLGALPKPGAWMVRVKQAFGVVILGTAIYYGYLSYTLFSDRWVDADEVATSVTGKLKEGWYASLGDGLAAAQREQKPVLVDMWATWCKNCLTMDKTTLTDAAVTAAVEDYVKIKLQAEDPDDPVTKAVMQRFGAVGLPAYAILNRGN